MAADSDLEVFAHHGIRALKPRSRLTRDEVYSRLIISVDLRSTVAEFPRLFHDDAVSCVTFPVPFAFEVCTLTCFQTLTNLLYFPDSR